MKHLKLFNDAVSYEAWKNSEDYVTPNVSYIEETKGVSYESYVEAKETRVVCMYNVTRTGKTQVCYLANNFTSMEVDGVLLDSVTTEYTFDTVGEHIIKFELSDPTTIAKSSLQYNQYLTSVVIPDSVTFIGDAAFNYCPSLNEIICNAPIAPDIWNTTFSEIKQNGILKVPKGSDYSTWMSTEYWYLGKYNWTIEYI